MHTKYPSLQTRPPCIRSTSSKTPKWNFHFNIVTRPLQRIPDTNSIPCSIHTPIMTTFELFPAIMAKHRRLPIAQKRRFNYMFSPMVESMVQDICLIWNSISRNTGIAKSAIEANRLVPAFRHRPSSTVTARKVFRPGKSFFLEKPLESQNVEFETRPKKWAGEISVERSKCAGTKSYSFRGKYAFFFF